jgi:hypothetical protein
MRCKRYDEAKTALEASIDRNSLQPIAHRYLAQLYRKHFDDGDTARQHRKLAKAARQQLKRSPEILARDVTRREIDLDAIPPITERSNAADVPLKHCINIVSGLPRSGTSMMMQMLAKGGLDTFTDGVREADTNNPRGYYEFELVKNLGRDHSWIDRAQGSVVKIVAPLLPKLPRDHAYRIVFMQRPLSETIASQQKMLERSDRQGGKLTPDRLAATFLQQVETIDGLLADYPQVSVLAVNYHDAIHDPIATAQRLSDFFDGQLDVSAATEAVDPSLHRERKDAVAVSLV